MYRITITRPFLTLITLCKPEEHQIKTTLIVTAAAAAAAATTTTTTTYYLLPTTTTTTTTATTTTTILLLFCHLWTKSHRLDTTGCQLNNLV